METKAYCKSFPTVKELVKYLNDNEIKREDIVKILDKELLLLVYYK